ncbi:hypothetical protein CLV28_0954 [Sediminihabitans luteus]|uniref:Secreted protein n=1 Tax=Sediminihabitans luteus TaxID=1138585 RepID=A0A2M9D165_9CELL|nr:hypothetical protein [Sediminihabitans luteus]PJJ77728.1 hypothetical protein CLV28_0954 [Sediminihabitans luteus]GIJ00045.1 hypothetical protein Slu03_24220 [Sediminihabitans luteus]
MRSRRHTSSLTVRATAVVAPAVLVLALAACSADEGVTLESEFLQAIDVAGGSTGEVDLVSTMHTDWQRIVIACPGQDPDAVLAAGGSDAGPATGDVPDLDDDSLGHLVLVDSGKVADVVDVPRDEADLCADAPTDPVVVTPGSATMTVTEASDGGWLVAPAS